MTNQNEMTVETALKNIALALGVTDTPRTIIRSNMGNRHCPTMIPGLVVGYPSKEECNLNVTPEALAARREIITSYAPFDTMVDFGKAFCDYYEHQFAGCASKAYTAGYKAAAECHRRGV